MKLLFLVVSFVLATLPATAQDSSTKTTVLMVNESNLVVCASGANVTFRHPTLADGVSPDLRKLVVECPALPQGTIWIEEQPVSPIGEAVRSGNGKIYIPFIKVQHER